MEYQAFHAVIFYFIVLAFYPTRNFCYYIFSKASTSKYRMNEDENISRIEGACPPIRNSIFAEEQIFENLMLGFYGPRILSGGKIDANFLKDKKVAAQISISNKIS